MSNRITLSINDKLTPIELDASVDCFNRSLTIFLIFNLYNDNYKKYNMKPLHKKKRI